MNGINNAYAEARDEFLDAIKVLVAAGHINIEKIREIRFPLHYPASMEEITVEELTEDNRSINALKREGIMNVKQLLEKWDDLRKLRNVGVKTKNIIKQSLMGCYYSNLNTEQRAEWLKEIVELNKIPEITD